MGPDTTASVVLEDRQVVEVALVHDDGDPRPLVEARVGGDRPVLARLDLGGRSVVLGRLLAIRLGLPSDGRTTVIDSLRIGDLELRQVHAELAWGEDLVVGVKVWQDLALAVLPSVGVVRFARGVSLVTDEQPESWVPTPDRRPFVDVVVEGGRVFVGEAPDPQWTDADLVRLAWAEADVAGAITPVARVPVPEGDPGDLLGRLRWGALAEARFAAGDLEGAAEADRSLLLSAGDRCDVWLAAGTRELRLLDPSAPETLRRARDLWERWSALTAEQRAAVRVGRSPGPGALAIEQPDGCARAVWMLRDESRVPVDPWSAARFAVDTGSEGAARLALARGAAVSAVRLALARTAAAQGREELVAAQIAEVAASDPPHPLTTALWIADHLGRERLEVVADRWLAARVVLGTVDREQLARRRVLEPGDVWTCALALVDEAPIPVAGEADCVAAALLSARRNGRGADEETARARLSAGWPDVWPDDTGPLAVRSVTEAP
ncbi:MAG: hypothetical protein H6738_06430 [Alphaproteobacteria bacterium]|nr:hypothetical protein [Alphaproteobacteria bacterium]